MQVSAKTDYALRALAELASSADGPPRSVEELAKAQEIPVSFLKNILVQLRSAGIVRSRRGPEGGYQLAKPADTISLAAVIRAVEGPLVGVRGERPEGVSYAGPAASLRDVWIAVRVNLREVLEQVSVADVAAGTLPEAVSALTREAGAWEPH